MRARPSFVPSLRKSFIGAAAVIALAVASLMGGAASAQADPMGTISGNVTGHGGYTFNSATFGDGAYAEVLISPNDNKDQIDSDTYADANGNWTSAPLAFGEYKVLFKANTPGNGPTFFPQWWTSDAPTSTFASAGVVTVTLDSSPTGINMVMTSKPAASGTVVDGKGTPLGDVTVNLHEHGGIVADTTTDDSGEYFISNDTAAADYTLEFVSDDATPVTTWYGGATAGAATALTLSNNTVDQLGNTTLPVPTSISGTVTDSNGNGLGGVDVTARNTDGAEFHSSTDESGFYEFPSIPADSWSLTFDDFGYNSATQAADTTSTRHLTGVDQVLTIGGSIVGTVKGKSGSKLTATQIIDVSALDPDGNVVATTTTFEGAYELDEIPFGTYTVHFMPESPNTANYAEVTHAGAVTLTADDETATVDQQLTAGGAVTGVVTTVRDGAKQPVGVHVTVSSATVTRTAFLQSFNSRLQARFTINGLPSGTYTIEYDPVDDNTYATQWWSGKYAATSATKVKVPSGKTISSLNSTVKKWVKAADLYVKAPHTDSVKVGDKLTVAAHSGTATVPARHTSTYRWFRVAATSGATAAWISGATKSAYVATNADAGYLIGVQVTQSATGYAPVTKVLEDTNQVSGARFTKAPTLALTGTIATGHTVSAKITGAFSPTPTTIDYTWEMNGTQVPASWSPVLTQMFLGWDDLGHGDPYSATATPPSDWLTAAGDVHVPQDDANTGSDTLSPVLAPQWSGQRITLVVCAERGEFYTKLCKSVTVSDARDLALRSIPTIAQSGSSLVATPGTWHSATTTTGTVSLAYQWYRDGVAVPGATKTTYTPVAADTGHALTVRVTGSAKGYTSTYLTSIDSVTP